MRKFYIGNITPEANTIFGSNPEGRHGAAKVARNQFGAIYGQGEGLQGNALPTKDLRVKENWGLREVYNSYGGGCKDAITIKNTLYYLEKIEEKIN